MPHRFVVGVLIDDHGARYSSFTAARRSGASVTFRIGSQREKRCRV